MISNQERICAKKINLVQKVGLGMPEESDINEACKFYNPILIKYAPTAEALTEILKNGFTQIHRNLWS